MRIVAIDAGNSRIKWGVWEDEWSSRSEVPTAEVGMLADALDRLAPPIAIHACSVAGPAVRNWLDAWARSRGIALHWLASSRERCGVRNAYREPTQLGADRWAALIAAWHLIRGAALVVNAGTAVTIDALCAQGAFRGGVIVPGLSLMTTSLASGTAGLPAAKGAFAQFPDNTDDAIATGALNAVCGAVDRMRSALLTSGAPAQVVLSGGAAPALEPHLEAPVLTVPYLVLEGLRIVASMEHGA
jgi:type III pantothenate kinase